MTSFRKRLTPARLLLTASALALTASAAVAAGDLIIAVPASIEPANLDYQIDPYTTTILFDSFMTDPLVIVAPDGTYQPALATAWEISEDATTYTFTLREDVVFQDGTPFNAEAVKFNYDRILAPETASAQLANNIGPLTAVEVVDEFTVRFVYDEPWVTFMDVARKAPMWSPTAIAASTLQDFDKQLVGTGPFILEEWVPNDHIRMTRWDEYGGWNAIMPEPGPVALDSVTIQFIGEPAVLGTVVDAGEAHIAFQIPALSVSQYTDRDDVVLFNKGQAGTGLSMVMNVRNPPLDNVAVRQALLYARDMPMVNDLLYDGLYEASDGPLNNIHRCFWPGATDMYPYDPAKSVELLESAGWVEGPDGIRIAEGVEGVEDGTPLTIRWQVLHHQEIGEALQALFREVGIDLQVEMVPGPVQLEQVQQRTFQIMYERLRNTDPKILDDIYNPKYDQPGGWAWTGYDNPELTALLEEVAGNPDDAARCEAAKEAQEFIMTEALMVPTLSDPSFVVASSDVQGFELGAEGTFFYLHNVTLAE
jgi:peptide/nickel transport system substrate-binding protein